MNAVNYFDSSLIAICQNLNFKSNFEKILVDSIPLKTLSFEGIKCCIDFT